MTITSFMTKNIDRTVILNLKTMENIGDLGLLQKYHNTFCCPSKILLKHFFAISLETYGNPPKKN